jgi:hypothetical protein
MYAQKNQMGVNLKISLANQYCRNQQKKTSFFPRTIVEWNHLPHTTVLSDSVKSFRAAIS